MKRQARPLDRKSTGFGANSGELTFVMIEFGLWGEQSPRQSAHGEMSGHGGFRCTEIDRLRIFLSVFSKAAFNEPDESLQSLRPLWSLSNQMQ